MEFRSEIQSGYGHPVGIPLNIFFDPVLNSYARLPSELLSGILNIGLLDRPGVIIRKTVDTRDIISVSNKAIRKVASDKSAHPVTSAFIVSHNFR